MEKGTTNDDLKSKFGCLTVFLLCTLLLYWMYLKGCTTTYDTKDELVQKAFKKEISAHRQERNFVNDGDPSHLWGAAEYYNDAIELYWKAIDAEDNDPEFDANKKLDIQRLERKIKDYYSY